MFKKNYCFWISMFSVCIIPFSLTSCNNSHIDLKSKTIPAIKAYDNIKSSKYQINNNTRFIIEKSMWQGKYNIREFIYNLASLYFDKLQTSNHPLINTVPIVVKDDQFNPYQQQNGDILFKWVDSFINVNNKIYNNINSLEAYQIDVNKTITISVLTPSGDAPIVNGFYYGAMSLLQLQLSNGGINHGIITDWPKVNERGIYFDFSGRNYSSDFVDKLIRECAWNKLNTIGLRFASGGCHINTHKDYEYWKQEGYDCSDGTYFLPNWDQYTHTNEPPSYIPKYNGDFAPLNICNNYADPDVPWNWDGQHSEFGKLLELAKLNGITLLPEMNVFSHAWFITDLTCPKNPDGSRKTTGFTDAEKEWDFAYYDDENDRIADAINLTGNTIGSKVAMDLIEDVVSYFADMFLKQGINTFSIGGDEYFENFRWHNAKLDEPGEKQSIVNSYYNFTHRLDSKLMEKGINTQQWNDDIFRNLRNQDLEDDFGFPATSEENNNKIIRYQNNIIADTQEVVRTIKQIKYWWKGDADDMNPLASIDDFINGVNDLGGGIESIINYDYWNLYFCDDTHGVRVPKAKTLYENWHPGIFSKNHELPGSPYQIYSDNLNGNYPSWIGGAMMSVWWDWSPWVMSTVYGPLKAFSQKCWNGTNKVTSFSNFEKIVAKIGHGIGV